MKEPKFMDFIGVFDEAIPRDVCKKIIDLHTKLDSLGNVRGGRTGMGEVKKAKHSRDVELSRFAMAQDALTELNNHIRQAFEIYQQKYWVVGEMLSRYELTAWQVQKYEAAEKGGYHSFHHEVSNRQTMARVLTYVLYLNDIKEGGETEFLFQNIRVKPEAGKIVFFPAYFTHVHRGNPVLSNQDKYIMTGWMEFV